MFDEDVEGEQIRANYRRGVRGSIQETREEDIESDKENELAEDDGEDAYWADVMKRSSSRPFR